MNYHILNELLDKTLISEKIEKCINEEQFEICTEIPMHQYKFNQRGFNQATIIAKWVEYRYKVRHLPLLTKTKLTTAQMSLKREDRIFNIKGVFSINNPHFFIDKKILLIDDVTTTASTLEECAKLLKQAQASKVWALVIASRR
jgi:competence protein ComFC